MQSSAGVGCGAARSVEECGECAKEGLWWKEDAERRCAIDGVVSEHEVEGPTPQTRASIDLVHAPVARHIVS